MVSDELEVPLSRGHHREIHRCRDETAWWRTVKRAAPRSSPTIFWPSFASSSAASEPVSPTPIVTTSTGFRR